MSEARVGVWIVGARGAVATTTALGLSAAARGLAPLQGVTTEGARGQGLSLAEPSAMVVGGWELRPSTLRDSARELAEGRIFDARLVRDLEEDLDHIDGEIVTGGTRGVPPLGERAAEPESPAAIVERLRSDLRGFRERNRLERLVVVNLATTEPAFTMQEDHLALGALEETIGSDRPGVFRPATLYAWSAVREGAAFLNFAASPSALVPAIRELAEREGVPYMGTDGKTGETLVKSALASLFRERDLKVLAWHGNNVLGNSDGAALAEPEVKAAKVETKDRVVRSILGYSPHTSVDITYVPSLGDWKTAWDLIHFEGFLGTRMTMQFTWQGADSILAAPLVIDLVRLADLALRRHESGPMTQAACFFKAPIGTQEHELAKQYASLDQYLRRCRVAPVASRTTSARRSS
ncbi:MAG: inositol-3-phosphate synthase [Candidatus Binatia bacterium]